ncbi:MAG: MAPEG family protein [Henriciella sp.]|nr:MAPEG family protein [Henriciella sp.]
MTFLSLLLLYALIFAFLVFFSALYTYYYYGFAYGFSSNRDPSVKPRTKFGLRVERTLQNHVENGALAIPVLGVAAIAGLESQAALVAGLIYILARVAFVILYYLGVPMIRGGVWTLGNLSLLYIVYVLLTTGTVALH